jgi:hypothetical protein
VGCLLGKGVGKGGGEFEQTHQWKKVRKYAEMPWSFVWEESQWRYLMRMMMVV